MQNLNNFNENFNSFEEPWTPDNNTTNSLLFSPFRFLKETSLESNNKEKAESCDQKDAADRGEKSERSIGDKCTQDNLHCAQRVTRDTRGHA